ncbi:MAG: hypothetical protein FJX69_20185, partial [Alphaproteobacteria bacterium]|nr:hypothetical protein [Alphaproteobacteria bacterium]
MAQAKHGLELAQYQQHVYMGVEDREERARHPRADHVPGEERDDRQTQAELERLRDRHRPEAASPVDRVERKQEVEQQRPVERPSRRRELEQVVHPHRAGFHRRDRGEARRMVQQVERDIGEEYKPAGEAQSPEQGRHPVGGARPGGHPPPSVAA